MPLWQLGDLCWYDYRVLLRDAVIWRLQQTDSGREYLERCWIMEQTKPDRGALREKFAKKGGGGIG